MPTVHSTMETMQHRWSPEWNVLLERQIWLTILEGQVESGRAFPLLDPMAACLMLADYNRYTWIGAVDVNLRRIERRERVLRHDLKARLEEFNYLAGHQYAHAGLTSADIVDNATQIRMRSSAEHLMNVAALLGLGMSTTQECLASWPMRGLKGAVGTQQDLLALMGDVTEVEKLEHSLAEKFHFPRILGNTGQVYPRSLDLALTSSIFADLSRELIYPQKVPRTHRALWHVLSGYYSMVSAYAGETWNEGDVSTSVIRRYALPNFFCTALEILEVSEA